MVNQDKETRSEGGEKKTASKVTWLRPSGGYRTLKSFQVTTIIYDATVLFCKRFMSKYSRMIDQMTQAARSGRQNIAEGSRASAISSQTELRLVNVARASLDELLLDYEDFLRQNNLSVLEPNHPALLRFKKKRCETLEDVRVWVAEEFERGKREHGLTRTDTDVKTTDTDVKTTDTDSDTIRPITGKTTSVPVRVSPSKPAPKKPIPPRALAANGALSLLNLGNYLLDRQIQRLAKDFLEKGGFTERLYRTRRKQKK